MSESKPLLLFAGRIGLWLIIITSLFALLVPHYTRLIVRASNLLIGCLEQPSRTVLVAQENRAIVCWAHSVEGNIPIARYNYELYFDAILFLTLLFATPKLPLLKRFACVLIGIMLIIALHIVSLTACARRDVAGRGWLPTFLVFVRPAFALLLWAVLTFRYWLPWPKSVLANGEQLRPNAPCPCGSGKKYKYCCGKRSR